MREERVSAPKRQRSGGVAASILVWLSIAFFSSTHAQVPVDIRKWNDFVSTVVIPSQVRAVADPRWLDERDRQANVIAELAVAADLVGATRAINQWIDAVSVNRDRFEQADQAMSNFIHFHSVLIYFGLHELALQIQTLDDSRLRHLPERFFVSYVALAMQLHCEVGSQQSLLLAEKLARIFAERLPTLSDRSWEHSRVVALFRAIVCLPENQRQKFIELEEMYAADTNRSVYQRHAPFRRNYALLAFLAFDRKLGHDVVRISGEPLSGPPMFIWQTLVADIASRIFIGRPTDYREIARVLDGHEQRRGWTAEGIVGEERRLLQGFIQLAQAKPLHSARSQPVTQSSIRSINSAATFVSAVTQAFRAGERRDLHWAEVLRNSESRYSLLSCIGLALLTEHFAGLPRLQHVCYLPRTPH